MEGSLIIMKNLEEYIDEAIEKMDNKEVIDLWECYCSENDCLDDGIYNNDMDTIDGCFSKPHQAVLAVADGDWHEPDEYFRFNGYGNIESFSYWNDVNSPIDVSALIDWLINDGIDAAEAYDLLPEEYYETDDDNEEEEGED